MQLVQHVPVVGPSQQHVSQQQARTAAPQCAPAVQPAPPRSLARAAASPGRAAPVDSDLPPLKAREAVAAAANRSRRVNATAEESANVLGRFLGLPGLAPATVLDLDQEQVLGILEAVWRRADPEIERALYGHAAAVTNRFYGGRVFFRGLVEFSNVCQNDCGYCGIRNNQQGVWRYTMPEEEVVEVAKWALQNNIRNIMLQSGELRTEQRIAYLERVIRAIRAETVAMDLAHRAQAQDGAVSGGSDTEHDDHEELGVAVSLSVGELPIEVYERFFKAGARRYLIRIETSNPELYARLHPPPLDWNHRVECLQNLKKVGYMLGTGVMVGLPGQTLRDLAGDVVFFKQMKADMIGMGPFITQPGTPVSDMWSLLYPAVNKTAHMKSMFELTTTMNALCRITMGNVNISATTAMQAIIPTGREIALERGANVVMPILTPTKYRESYQLYEGKPCITDTAVQCRACLDMRLKFAGKEAAPDVWGDPDSYLHPVAAVSVPHDLLAGAPVLDAAASADFHELGASASHPMPLARLREVAEDNIPAQKHAHGSRPRSGSHNHNAHSHDGHDDAHSHDAHSHDDHDHGHGADHDEHHVANNAVPFEPATTMATAAARASTPAAAGAMRQAHSSLLRPRTAATALSSGAQAVRPRSMWVAVPHASTRFAATQLSSTACSASAGNGATSSAASGVPSATANGVPRINVGVFGKMNAGKSTLVNVLAQQEACIVDSTPGTTADVKTVLMELHGLGPAKILDTAGLDETGVLGEKKRRKALNTLKECDVAVIVVDSDAVLPGRSQLGHKLAATLEWERRVMEQSAKYGVSPVVLLNLKHTANSVDANALMAEVKAALDPTGKFVQIPAMAVDLAGPARVNMLTCSDFVKLGATRSPRWGKPLPGCLPRWSLGKGALLLMVIPMDAETPGGRLLRPQAMVQEEAIRHWATVVSVRLDLDAARGKLGPEAREAERQRFTRVVRLLEQNTEGPSLVVTDSQAVDVVHPWTCDPGTGRPLVPFTTFSIAMAYHQSGGVLDPFVEGLEALTHLAPGDHVLIAEACNHTRITDTCNDIGMVQIPSKLEAMAGGKLHIEHAFGREFPELESGKLGQFKVAIHCGGCMIDTQKMQQRMHDMAEAHVPVVNYGTFFSWAVAPEALQRALEPWGLEPPLRLTATKGPAAGPVAGRQPAGATSR